MTLSCTHALLLAYAQDQCKRIRSHLSVCKIELGGDLNPFNSARVDLAKSYLRDKPLKKIEIYNKNI